MYANNFHVSIKDLRVQYMIMIQSSNNPRVDVLRPAQKLQVWNTYIPEYNEILLMPQRFASIFK